MNRLWTYKPWFTPAGLATSITYLANLGDWASKLDRAIGEALPILGELVPFLAIGLAAICLPPTAKLVWAKTFRSYRLVFHRDAEKLRECAEDIVELMTLMSGIDRVFDFTFGGERMQMITNASTKEYMLSKRLRPIGLSFPSPVKFNDPRDRANLIAYLTAVGNLAIERDIHAARGVPAAIITGG